jgi:UDP-N-acetylmuramoyl-tripeptide--D-alanyl-D-alanine ligase
VVGTPQQQHFAMVFAAATKAGFLPDSVRAEHVGFGSVLGADRKLLRTRSGDSPSLIELLDEASERADAAVRATDVESLGLEGLAYTLHARGESAAVRLPLIGRHFVTASLGAAALALEEGCSLEDVSTGLARVPDTRRLQPRRLPNGATLLDDAYNASPDSINAALDVLAALPGQRIAVLGDMFELGDYAETAHRAVGEHVPGRADALVTVGALGGVIAETARAAGMDPEAVHACADNAEAIDAVRRLLVPGDHVLVKASHGMHLEEIVRALLDDARQEVTTQ